MGLTGAGGEIAFPDQFTFSSSTELFGVSTSTADMGLLNRYGLANACELCGRAVVSNLSGLFIRRLIIF